MVVLFYTEKRNDDHSHGSRLYKNNDPILSSFYTFTRVFWLKTRLNAQKGKKWACFAGNREPRL
jgi:hypothetical protein